MSIHELFDKLREEPDWTKEVAILTDDGLRKIKDVVPNIINDTQVFISLEQDA